MKPHHMGSLLGLVAAAGLLAQTAAPAKLPLRAPSKIELRDQYDQVLSMNFPTNRPVVLTIADRKGSDQVDGWVAPLKKLYEGRILIAGLADVRGVPGLLRGRVRARFADKTKYPVMLDWTGSICSGFQENAGVVNVLLLDRDGVVRFRFEGPVTEAALREAGRALDALLESKPGPGEGGGRSGP